MQEDGESCQEEVERGSHAISGLWIEVTITPVDRLEIAHLEKSLWRGKTLICGEGSRMWEDKMLVCGGENMPGRDRILLCGGKDTSG